MFPPGWAIERVHGPSWMFGAHAPARIVTGERPFCPDCHVTGAKPAPFLTWLFGCLGARPGDELIDLYPGSGAVARAWESFSAQPELDFAAARSNGADER